MRTFAVQGRIRFNIYLLTQGVWNECQDYVAHGLDLYGAISIDWHIWLYVQIWQRVVVKENGGIKTNYIPAFVCVCVCARTCKPLCIYKINFSIIFFINTLQRRVLDYLYPLKCSVTTNSATSTYETRYYSKRKSHQNVSATVRLFRLVAPPDICL